jgi:hypothetical protein
MFARRLDPFCDYSSTDVTPPSPDSVRNRFRFINDVLFPSVEEQAKSQSALIKSKFANKFKTSSDPFPDESFVMVKDPTRSARTLSHVIKRIRTGMISKNLSPPHALKKLYKPFTVLTPD